MNRVLTAKNNVVKSAQPYTREEEIKEAFDAENLPVVGAVHVDSP